MNKLIYISLLSAVCLFPAPSQGQTIECKAPTRAPGTSCSMAALNGECTILIKRENPVVPANVYVRPGKSVRVLIDNASPFERLTLDRKSGQLSPPPDTFSQGFTALTTALGGILIPGGIGAAAAALAPGPVPAAALGLNGGVPPPLPPPPPPSDFGHLQGLQAKLRKDMKAGVDALKAITAETSLQQALQLLARAVAQPATGPYDRMNAHAALQKLKTDVDGPFGKTATELTALDQNYGLEQQVKDLDDQVADVELKPGVVISEAQVKVLRATEAKLDDAYSTFNGLETGLSSHVTRIQAVVDGLQNTAPVLECDILAPDTTRHNVDTETWILNSDNLLADQLTPLLGDKVPDQVSVLYGNVAKPPAKSAILTVQATYKTTPEVEFSAGILFPVLPFHSYQAVTSLAAVSTVQKTTTWAVIPDVSINFRLQPESSLGRSRYVTMFTVAAGYSTATTSAAFAFGPSFAIGSMVLSPLAVAAQDTRLTGGFAANGTLVTGVTAPETHNVWSIKPSCGISLRLPLKGSSN